MGNPETQKPLIQGTRGEAFVVPPYFRHALRPGASENARRFRDVTVASRDPLLHNQSGCGSGVRLGGEFLRSLAPSSQPGDDSLGLNGSAYWSSSTPVSLPNCLGEYIRNRGEGQACEPRRAANSVPRCGRGNTLERYREQSDLPAELAIDKRIGDHWLGAGRKDCFFLRLLLVAFVLVRILFRTYVSPEE